MPRFSVITVCKNEEARIAVTLESLVAQSYTDFEYIIVDGQSTDSTVDIVESYRSSFRKLSIISETDNGIYEAMNKGVIVASGEWISFLNAGDFYYPDTLIEVVHMVEVESDAKIIVGANALVNSAHNIVHIHYPKRGRFIAHPSTFTRADLFLKYGLFRTDYKIFADQLFYGRLWDVEKIVTTDKVLSAMDDGGISTRINKAYMDELFKLYRALGNGFLRSFIHSYAKLMIKKVINDTFGNQVVYSIRRIVKSEYRP